MAARSSLVEAREDKANSMGGMSMHKALAWSAALLGSRTPQFGDAKERTNACFRHWCERRDR
jgi:hypothetical protein